MQTIPPTDSSGDIPGTEFTTCISEYKTGSPRQKDFFLLFFIITQLCCRSQFLKTAFRKTLLEIAEVLYWGSFEEEADVLSNIQGKAEGG